MQDTFTYYCDPGHGWLMVHANELKTLGLKPKDFSAQGQYLQKRGPIYYLEEDCDAPQFLAAYEAKTGTKPTIKEVYIDDRRVIGLR
jgi:hypothetical protein